jgi:hypothetical protein
MVRERVKCTGERGSNVAFLVCRNSSLQGDAECWMQGLKVNALCMLCMRKLRIWRSTLRDYPYSMQGQLKRIRC